MAVSKKPVLSTTEVEAKIEDDGFDIIKEIKVGRVTYDKGFGLGRNALEAALERVAYDMDDDPPTDDPVTYRFKIGGLGYKFTAAIDLSA